MISVFEKLYSALSDGQDAVLCSIVTGHGSAPRGTGAKMAVFQDGSTCGTIGGGAVELISSRMAMDVLASGESVTHPFCLAPNQINDIGMVCGGDVTVYFRFFDHKLDLPLTQRILTLLKGEINAWLIMRMHGDDVTELGIFDEEAGLQYIDDVPQELLKKHLHSGSDLCKGEPSYFFEPIATRGNVYIFGGGHVCRELAPLLAHLGFRVSVYDNRPDFASAENYPGAKAVICGSFDDIFSHVSITKDDYVIVMTPGHQADYAVVRQALQTPAHYIGCIGSRAKIETTKKRLAQDGFCDSEIARMISPIGLSILAETPAEIAVSIAGQLICIRAERQGSKKAGWK